MKRMKFTDRSIAALKHGPDRYWVWEEGRTGLGIRVAAAPSKLKTWQLSYWFNKKPRRMGLGAYPASGLKEARAKWRAAKALLDKGIDPKDAEDAERKIEEEAETVSQLAEIYIKEWLGTKRRGKESERMLRRDVLPALGSRKAKDVTRGEIKSMLRRITERNAPISSNRVLAVVRHMFNWAIDEEHGAVTSNPAAGIRGQKEVARERVLSTTEIKSFWHNLDTAGISREAAFALRLILTTAQRPGEVVAAEWGEIDTTDNVWIIPSAKTKNEKEHRVPLSPLTLQLLQEIGTTNGDPNWVFPSPHTKGRHLSEEALSYGMRRNLQHFVLENVTPHDLRRTAASYMTSMKIPRLVVDKILNHADASVGAIYDRHAYWQEKLEAATRWSDRLAVILSEDKTVVELTA